MDEPNLSHSLIVDLGESTTAETKTIVGRTIVDLRLATDEELLLERWPTGYRPTVMVLDDGTKVYAAGMDKQPGRLLLLIPDDAAEIRVWRKAQLGLREEPRS